MSLLPSGSVHFVSAWEDIVPVDQMFQTNSSARQEPLNTQKTSGGRAKCVHGITQNTLDHPP